MAISKDEIKLFESQRLTDEGDGGQVNEFDWSPVAQEQERSLTGSRSFTVIFDRADGSPIEAQQLFPLSAPTDGDIYTVVMRLLTVS
ncbi:hypothetical protein E1189_01200 [Sansalvadorimonas verongulae]|nr:hypothetical protein [Sansalvadorimonas verongulae]